MSDQERTKTAIVELAAGSRGKWIPVSSRFSYFSTPPLAEDDVRQYVHDPLAAVSPKVIALLPKVLILLAPYIEKGNGKGDLVVSDRPPESRWLAHSIAEMGGSVVLAIGVQDVEVADYHYRFYAALSELTTGRWPEDLAERFYRVIREELSAEVHGEVDERSWHLKQALLRRQTNVRKETKLFREYARQAFEDTLTLYLHGTCCDIDVETGPRQMPSRYLRRRLELLLKAFPPPEGFAVFPEQLKTPRP
jgi:hypothetical protein